MKITSLFLLLLTLFSCKESINTKQEDTKIEVIAKDTKGSYPEVLMKVLDAHGGVANWKKQKTLTYEIPSEKGVEKQTVDLISRKDKISNGIVQMGFDGENVWLLDEAKTYKGDPVFYHNLMFYFYSMPFVLADKGIVYGKTEDLKFEGKSYPGISISYNPGVGISYKDEYYLHYDPETYQMAWLGYTVSYRTGEKSDNIKWIRYNDWMKIEDVKLPKSITWYAYEGREIKGAKNTVNFENVELSTKANPDGYYAKPELATIVTGKQQ